MYETDSSGKPCKVTGLQVQSELKEFDAVVAAVDLPGAKKLIPKPFRVYPEFDRIYELDAVPIATCSCASTVGARRPCGLHAMAATHVTFQQRRLGHRAPGPGEK